MIDSHHHLWKYDPVRHAWINDDMKVIRRDFDPEDLKPLLDQHSIEGTVVVQVDQSEEETMMLLEIADNHDWIKGVVGWIDLKDQNIGSKFQHFRKSKKLKGFRHIVQAEGPGFLLDQNFIRGVQQLPEYGFTYDLLIYHHQLDEAVVFADKVMNTRIVIDHLAKPPIARAEIREWEKHIRKLATFPNFYCKISGMVTEAKRKWKYEDFVPYLDVVLVAFGPARLMYGSDWPVCLVAASYKEQKEIADTFFDKLSSSEKHLVFGENAKRFYNL